MIDCFVFFDKLNLIDLTPLPYKWPVCKRSICILHLSWTFRNHTVTYQFFYANRKEICDRIHSGHFEGEICTRQLYEELCITLAYGEEWHTMQDNSPLKEQCLEFVKKHYRGSVIWCEFWDHVRLEPKCSLISAVSPYMVVGSCVIGFHQQREPV